MGKCSCLSYCGIICLIYSTIVLLKIIVDVRWTSFSRGMLETIFWLSMPLYPFADSIFRHFHVDTKYLTPNEAPPEVYYIQPGDDPVKVLVDAAKTLDRIVVWENFIKESGGFLDNYQDEQFVRDTFNKSDIYDFMKEYSTVKYASMSLGDAWDRMQNKKDLYLGFSHVLMKNNPAYQQAVFDAIAYHGEEFKKVTNLGRTFHHGFLYKGAGFSTGMHQAPIADWFIQISNTKVWRFVHPSYTPYIRPMAGYQRVGMTSGYPYIPNDTPIPYVDVETKAGSLMYFPPNWWHEVHNIHDDQFGLACGFRPKESVFPLKWLAMPWSAPRGLIMHKLGIIPGLVFGNLLYDTIFGKAYKSGVEWRKHRMVTNRNRFKSYGWDWTWEKWAMKGDNFFQVDQWKSEL